MEKVISADRGELSATDAEALTGISHQTVSKWRKRLQDVPKYREALRKVAYRKAELEAADNHRAKGTHENEWYTPAQYVEAARQVMGEIDLDPASNQQAQKWIKAKKFYTVEQNGLNQKWLGKVWLNPPYAQPAIAHFVEKMVDEVKEGRVTEAVMLTHNYTDTSWFHLAESACAAICFTRGRIKFVDPDGEVCAPTQGQAFFYYGDRPQAFAEIFRKFGFVR